MDIRGIIKRFRRDKLTDKDLTQVYVKEYICEKSEYLDDEYKIGDNITIYFVSGDGKSNMDNHSLHLIKDSHYSKLRIRCKVLFVQYNSDIGEDLGLSKPSGFYHYNPTRLLPDSILALKVIEVIKSNG